MSNLSQKRVLLGVTGGIAAYKSADLVRRLKESGADVQVVLTKHATEFVSALTFQALSGKPARTGLYDRAAEAAMSHIELARWADLILVAPATAGFMARLAAGLADDLLSTLCLASRAPVVLAPAMNNAMWQNAATQANADTLIQRGIRLMGPDEGDQACGESGAGRMLEPLQIREMLEHYLGAQSEQLLLQGKTVLLTAGPTREAIDPVRYISNHSSGKMGYALAQAAYGMGARVVLVSGPVNLPAPRGIEVLSVQSALEMRDAVMRRAPEADIFIAVAAVADYRVKTVQSHKIKKSNDEMMLSLVRNPDILSEVAAMPQGRPFCVGFAAETDNLEHYATSKLGKKNLDMIAANLVSQNDTVFNSEFNALEIYMRDQKVSLPRASKHSIAVQLLQVIANQTSRNQHTTP